MAVLEPLKVTIVNLPADAPSEVSMPNFPADESKGSHTVPFGKTLYIEQSDFKEVSGEAADFAVYFSGKCLTFLCIG
jgi:glutaminyl-tRNA synthetase